MPPKRSTGPSAASKAAAAARSARLERLAAERSAAAAARKSKMAEGTPLLLPSAAAAAAVASASASAASAAHSPTLAKDDRCACPARCAQHLKLWGSSSLPRAHRPAPHGCCASHHLLQAEPSSSSSSNGRCRSILPRLPGTSSSGWQRYRCAFAGPPEMWSVVILYYSSIMIFYPLGQVAIEECEKRVAALEPGGGTGSGGHTMLAGGSSTRPGSGTPTSMAAGFFPPPTQWLRFGNCAGGY